MSATGGEGGGGEGAGGGGDATAGATITGASELNVTVSAVRGAGGSELEFNGSTGAATANANVTSTNGPATANVTATGAAATAAATVTATNGPATANVTGDGAESGSASATSSAAGANMAVASIDDAAPAFATGEQALAVVTAEPDAASIADVTSANSSIAAAFADNPIYLGLAELGGAATATIAGAQTITDNIKLNASLFTSSGYLVLGYYDGTTTGSGFSDLTLAVAVDGTTELNQSFSSVASLDNYFSDNVVGIGLLATTVLVRH